MTDAENCLFCRIVAGLIPADVVYRDTECVAFRDINPKAPVHILLIPVKHLDRLSSASADDTAMLGHLLSIVPVITHQEKISDKGFRVVINNGPEGGQEVDHLHLHLLGGRKMTWPPG